MSFKLPTLTIVAGSAVSDNTLELTKALRKTRNIIIYSPVDLPETVKVQVAADSSSVFVNLQDSGVDIVLAPGGVLAIQVLAYGAIRLMSSSGNAAGSRVFKVTGDEMLFGG